MEIPLFLACDFANTTNDGKLNTLGVFHRIYSYEFPTFCPNMYIVAKVILDEDEEINRDDAARIVLTGSNGKELMSIPQAVNSTEMNGLDRAAVNIIIKVTNLNLPNSGKHEFQLYIDDVIKKSFFVDVIQLEKGEIVR